MCLIYCTGGICWQRDNVYSRCVLFIVQVVYVGRETMCTVDVFYLLYRWYMMAERQCVHLMCFIYCTGGICWQGNHVYSRCVLFIVQVVYDGRETMCTFDVFYLLYRWYMLVEKPCVQ
jgi:hypothetical protein